jgi:hypothetical protein
MNVSVVLPRQVEIGPELSELSCVVLRVTAPDLSSPRGTTATLPPGAASIELRLEVPAGANRRFEAEAFAEAEACDVEAISPSFIPNFIPRFRQRGDIVEDITPSGTSVIIPMEAVTGPVVRPPALPVDPDGAEVALQIVALDPERAPLTYAATGLPPGLRIDPATGGITGTLTRDASAGSPYSVNVTVSNGAELDSVTFPWTITNPAPILTLPFVPVANVFEGELVSLQPEANDPDGDALTFSATGLPPGLSIDPTTGLISGTLSRTAAAGSPHTIAVTVSDGSANASRDFNLVVINPVPVLTAPGDQANNEGEPVTLQLAANDPDGDPLMFGATGLPPGLGIDPATGLISGTLSRTAAAGSPYAVTVEVADGTDTGRVAFTWEVAPVFPEVSIIDRTTPENNATGAVFTVTLSAATGRTVTVAFATANDSATAGQDYEGTSGTLTFAPGITSQTLTVAILNDTLDEPTETFLVNLSAPSNATLVDAQGVGAIQDDDAAPALAINNVTVTEGNSGTTNASFAVTLSAASGQPTTVSFATADGSAMVGQDYRAVSGTLVFPPGTTSRPITVGVLGDTVDERNQETFAVNLSAPINATLADAQGVGTIQDDDAPPTLSINNVTVTEGNSGTSNAGFTVTLSAVSSKPVTVNFATADGSAIAGQDYRAVSGTLTFPPGTASRPITVVVLGDTVDERDPETFTINLSTPTNATLAGARGVGAIQDDDAPPSLAINNVTATEGNTGTTDARFTVTLSAASGQPVTVSFATANNSAIATADYQAVIGVLTFPPGATTQPLIVPVVGDFVGETNETFFVNLSSATNAVIATAQGVGTIVDDDLTAFVSSAETNQIWRYDASSGDFLDVFVEDDPNTPDIDESGGLKQPGALLLDAEGRLCVASTATHLILCYDADTGTPLGPLVSDDPATPNIDESGGLQEPAGMIMGPDGTLYVASAATDQILRYDGSTGAFLGALGSEATTAPNADTGSRLRQPGALLLDAEGRLCAASTATHQILCYDADTGTLLGPLVSDDPTTPDVDESGGLQHPAGMALGPDGWLYVSSFKTNEILRFHAVTGDFAEALVGDANSGLQAPGLLLFGPDQQLYVSSLGTHEILRFHAVTGTFIDVYMITGGGSEGQTHHPSLVFGPQTPSAQPSVVMPSGGAEHSQRQ